MFILEGVPAILLGIGVFFYLTDTPDQAEWLSPDGRRWLVSTLGREQANAATRAAGGLRQVFTSIDVWLLVLVYFGLNGAGYGVMFWLPSVIRSLSGIGTMAIGLLTAVPYAAALVAMVLVGRHSDRSGEHRWHTAGAAFLGAAALFLAGHSSSVGPMVGAIS